MSLGSIYKSNEEIEERKELIKKREKEQKSSDQLRKELIKKYGKKSK